MSRVVVGLSGGVDSATAAYLLQKEGYDVIGMTMQICRDARTPWELDEIAQAKSVADSLGIPQVLEDFRGAFARDVEDHFAAEYFAGRTPNPCIICNRMIKWRALIRCADENKARHIATGHYARVVRLPNGRYAVARSAGGKKDQSYVLFMLTQEMLSRTLFPAGEHEKPDIRRIAGDAALPAADTPDSQDICFVSGHDYAGYLAERAPERMPGEGDYISASDGRIIGRHRGYLHYTIGQTRRLGVAVGHPLYVSEIRPGTNEVILSDEDVYSSVLSCSGLNFMGLSPAELPVGASFRATGKIRYAHAGAPCTVTRTGEDELSAVFDEPVRAVTPGQAAVFYDEGGAILAGGWISANQQSRMRMTQ